jgi:caspase domain-containing protein
MSRRIAFLWGSNANKHYPRLKYAARDVERLQRVLKGERYGFEVVTPPDGSDPQEIHRRMVEVIASCGPDDVFISYFSGHGQLIGPKLYLVLDRSVPSEAQTLFSSTSLMEALGDCRARKRLAILDCCNAGAAIGEKGAGVEVAQLFPRHPEERVLFASNKLEAARELPELQGSFLTHVLCEALKQAPQGAVTLLQVLDALQDAALNHNRRSESSSRLVPVPYLSGPLDDFHFTPARAASGKIVLTPPPAPPPSRPPAVRRITEAVRTGLRAASSDGQGAYIFAMLAFGLAALFFHESFRGQSEALDQLEHYIEQQRTSSLRPWSTPNLDSFLLPDRTQSLCDPFLAVWLELAHDTFANASEKARGDAALIRVLTPLLGPVAHSNGYRIESLYYIPRGWIFGLVWPVSLNHVMFTRGTTPNTLMESQLHALSSSSFQQDQERLCESWPMKDVLRVYDGILPTFIYFNDQRGVIETVCRAIIPGDLDAGVLCADIALPEQLAVARFREIRDVLAIEELETVTESESAKNTTVDADLIRRVVAFQPADTAHRSGTSPSWRVAKIHRSLPSRQSHVEHSWNWSSLSLSALCLIAGMAVLVTAFRSKLRRQQFILSRGLQYGLLELSDGKITGANDRAEEILRTKLPRLGIRSARGALDKTFAPRIDEQHCVLIPPDGRRPSMQDVCSYDGRIRDRATDGLTSVFYAWVNAAEMWIKITSTVILLPSGAERVFCALDTAIDGEHQELLATVRRQSTLEQAG